jgi:hypothetical protein
VAGLALCSAARAQTAPAAAPAPDASSAAAPASAATASQHYNLALPMLTAGSNDPYNLTPNASGQAVTAATTPAQPALPDSYTFDSFRQNIHGYVAAGVATHNGHNFEGGVSMPLVPGKADLALSASTGQIGGFTPVTNGNKQTLNYTAYSASLHLHPADNVDAYIGITHAHVGLPTWPGP